MTTEHKMSDERLAAQAELIRNKLPTSKLFDKYGLTLVDSNNTIIISLMGELRNIILGFFKGGPYASKRCEHCGTLDAKQYERAHNKGESRPSIAKRALERIRPDETARISQKEFMKAFIEEHIKVPLWFLCTTCHKKYDSSRI
jgi:hypothetical protein